MTAKSAKPKGKTCSKCKETKPFSEFTKAQQNKDGYYGQCKACWKAYGKAYEKINKEKLTKKRRENSKKPENIKRRKAYYKTNKEKIEKQKKVWLEANPEKRKAYSKSSYEKNCKDNPEHKKKRKERWEKYKEDPENLKKIKASNRAYTKSGRRSFTDRERRKNNPLIRLGHNIRTGIRRSFCNKGFTKTGRTREILDCSFGKFKVWIESQLKEGMTLENIHLDHIVPISLAETVEEVILLNHYSNFQPLFRKDNIKKHNKLILSMVSPENKIRYKEIIERAQKQRSR